MRTLEKFKQLIGEIAYEKFLANTISDGSLVKSKSDAEEYFNQMLKRGADYNSLSKSTFLFILANEPSSYWENISDSLLEWERKELQSKRSFNTDGATYQRVRKDLGEDDFNKFVNNVFLDRSDKYEESFEELHSNKSTSDIIRSAFAWSDSVEGLEFWIIKYKELQSKGK